MKIHNIPFEAFVQKGKGSLEINNGEMFITSNRVLDKNGMRVYAPNKFKLPFRIDITLKSNLSDYSLQIGKGHIRFSGAINSSVSGINRVDILTGGVETVKADYDNILPLNEYVNLSVIYSDKITWIEINGKPCYHTRLAPYLKLLGSGNLPVEFLEGLDFAIGCGKNVELIIKSLTVTEYESNKPDISAEIANLPELSPFEWYIKGLSPEIKNEMIKTDEFLMKDMKSILKFKKQIDKYGHLTYKSPCGLEYMVFAFGTEEYHEISWDYMKKPDYTDVILNKLAESSPEFADRMFTKLWDCPSPTCKRISKNEYNGKSKIACRSTVVFNWLPSEFEDVRKVIVVANEVMKTANKIK